MGRYLTVRFLPCIFQRRRLEIEVSKLKLQKRKIWNYFYFSEPSDEFDGDRKHFQLVEVLAENVKKNV